MTYTLRPAAETDDFGALSRLIYLADPYTYPAWFHYDEALALKGLAWLMRNDALFSYRRVLVAAGEEEPLGALLYLEKGAQWDPASGLAMWRALGEPPSPLHQAMESQYLRQIVRFDTDLYVLNLAVAPQARRQGVAGALLRRLMADHPGCSTLLEVVAENRQGLALYQRQGFTIADEFPTFAPGRTGLVSYHMRHGG